MVKWRSPPTESCTKWARLALKLWVFLSKNIFQCFIAHATSSTSIEHSGLLAWKRKNRAESSIMGKQLKTARTCIQVKIKCSSAKYEKVRKGKLWNNFPRPGRSSVGKTATSKFFNNFTRSWGKKKLDFDRQASLRYFAQGRYWYLKKACFKVYKYVCNFL